MTSEPDAIIPADKAISAALESPFLPMAILFEYLAAALPMNTASSGEYVPIILFSCKIAFIFFLLSVAFALKTVLP